MPLCSAMTDPTYIRQLPRYIERDKRKTKKHKMKRNEYTSTKHLQQTMKCHIYLVRLSTCISSDLFAIQDTFAMIAAGRRVTSQAQSHNVVFRRRLFTTYVWTAALNEPRRVFFRFVFADKALLLSFFFF